MYDAVEDPYCYPGTDVLINKLGLRDAARLQAFEEEISRERAAEPLPAGRLDAGHYKAIHRHLFQDVYSWAGKPRTVRMTKGDSSFCYPEYIEDQLAKLFDWLKRRHYLSDLTAEEFSTAAAHFLSELNVIHAFREGNGRTQLAFLALLAARAGHPLELDRLDPGAFLAAMIHGFQGDEGPLGHQIRMLIG